MGHKARTDRTSVFVMARTAGDPSAEAARYLVRNLSPAGVCISGASSVCEGQRLTLTVGQVERVDGEVAWVRGDQAGITFAEPIDTVRARSHRGGVTVPAQTGWLTGLKRPHERVHG